MINNVQRALQEVANQELSIEERLKRLANYDGDDQVVPADVLRDFLQEKRASCKTVAFSSGIHSLDALIGGFIGGELTVISGKTKHGKTLLCQTFTNAMRENTPSIWFSYEVRPEQFISQFGPDLPFFTMPKRLKSNDTRWLEERIVEAVLKYDCQAVFIDNTHNLLNMAGDNLTHRIDEFVKRLKEIAISQNIHIFLLHHISKGEVNNVNDLNSNLLRDSSMIAQTADNVFFIFRDDDGAWLKITENRRNGVFNKTVRLRKEGYFFAEDMNPPLVSRFHGRGAARRKDHGE